MTRGEPLLFEGEYLENAYTLGAIAQVRDLQGLVHDCYYRVSSEEGVRLYSACGSVFEGYQELHERSTCIWCVIAPPPKVWV